MKRHQIKAYQSNMPAMSAGPNLMFGMNALALTAMGLLLTFFISFWYIWVALFVIHMLLWVTNEQFNFNSTEIKYWKIYRSLDKETQKRINLDRDYFYNLTQGAEWSALANNLNALKAIEEKRSLSASSEKGRHYKDVFEQVIAEKEEEVRIAQEVHEEMKERQLL